MKNTATSIALLSTLTLASATDWPDYRGPFDNGTGDPSLKLPSKFSTTDNVAWSVDLPGRSAATPAIVDGKIYLTAAVESDKSLHALCLDAKTGKTLWDKTVSKGRIQLDDRSNLASPSAAVEDGHVVFYFGTGELLVTNPAGEQLWEKNVIGSDDHYFSFQWTYSTSPVIHDGQVIIQVLQRDTSFNFNDYQRGPEGEKKNPSYLIAYDLKSGKQLWKSERKSDAVAESLEGFSSPAIYNDGSRDMILVTGGDAITGHDAKNGKELWRWATWNPNKIGHWRLVPSPVAGAGVALACAPKKEPIYAVSTKNGKLLWKSEDSEISSDVATPLFYKGHFYIVNGEYKDKRISCVEPKTGNVLWTGEIGTRAKIESSPHAADDKIYFMDHNGTVFVVAADPKKFTLLNRAEFGDKRT
ncbi:MAG: PQQ-binding-like beta-propeller repeat protein, partial [Verrucomicrobiales bacterium]|nr:PQQ-binding-like beta-propeller repeat protein [Verrucomicrobiales bacterium]